MPEERGLYPKMRVRDQLRYLARLHGHVRGGRGVQWTDVLPRAARRGRARQKSSPVQDLSLGNQQRVQLAAALVHDPVAAGPRRAVLRPGPRGRGRAERRAGGRGVAGGVPVLFSSHQLDLVERVCDEVVIIHAGRVVAGGHGRGAAQARPGGRQGRPRPPPAPARRARGAHPDDWFADLPGVTPGSASDRGRCLLDLAPKASTPTWSWTPPVAAGFDPASSGSSGRRWATLYRDVVSCVSGRRHDPPHRPARGPVERVARQGLLCSRPLRNIRRLLLIAARVAFLPSPCKFGGCRRATERRHHRRVDGGGPVKILAGEATESRTGEGRTSTLRDHGSFDVSDLDDLEAALELRS